MNALVLGPNLVPDPRVFVDQAIRSPAPGMEGSLGGGVLFEPRSGTRDLD
jgi:hypothetical protein